MLHHVFSLRLVRLLSRILLIVLVSGITLYLCSYTYVVRSFSGNAVFPADCAIVFGAAVYRGTQPGPAITRRVGEAAQLYREGKVKRLIVTGGKGEGNTRTEGDVMRQQALLQNVKAQDITVEDQARSTWENLENTKNLTSTCSSVVAVSDQYHLGRIKLLAFRQGWRGLMTWPSENHPPVGLEQKGFAREVFAVLYYALFLDELHIWPTVPEPSEA